MVLLLSAATNQVLGLLGSCTSSSCDHAIGLMKRNEKKNSAKCLCTVISSGCDTHK